jgi:serine/threonine-protein kinase RsbW
MFRGALEPGIPINTEGYLLKTHFRADYTNEIQNVALARRGVTGFASACGFSESEIADIRLAAGEALSNAVEHGSGAQAPGFSVECNFDGNELSIEIRDSGQGFSAPSNGRTVEPDHRGRGFGIFLMRRLMDDVVFANNGTVVRLVRRHPGGIGIVRNA